MSVLDDYLVDRRLSLLEKTRIQGQVPVLRALGREKADSIVTDDIAAAGKGEVTFAREQTLMQGAPSCTFRHKFAPR